MGKHQLTHTSHVYSSESPSPGIRFIFEVGFIISDHRLAIRPKRTLWKSRAQVESERKVARVLKKLHQSEWNLRFEIAKRGEMR